MTALLELKDIRRSYPSGDGPVEVRLSARQAPVNRR